MLILRPLQVPWERVSLAISRLFSLVDTHIVCFGGGAPSAEHDIRLSDVVVSRPEGSHGGVIQHDMGKFSKDGKIQRIGGSKSHVSFYIGYAINTVELSYEWHIARYTWKDIV